MEKTTILYKLQQTVHAIKIEILNSPNIRKLLRHSTPDALKKQDVSKDVVDLSIVTTPYINEEDPDLELNMETFIAIYQTSITPTDNQNIAFLTTAIYTNQDLYQLDNNMFRLNMIGHEIELALNNLKLNLAGTLVLYDYQFVSLSNSKKLGLVLSWQVVDA